MADFAFPIAEGVVIDGSLGYINGRYTRVLFDLNGDGVLNAADKALKIPRLAPWNGNVGVTLERRLPIIGNSTVRVSYAYRDAAAYTDNNRGTLNELKRIDASLAIKVVVSRGVV